MIYSLRRVDESVGQTSGMDGMFRTAGKLKTVCLEIS